LNGRTAIYTGPKTIEIREYPVLDPGAGEMMLRIKQAGLCGSDLHIWRGELGEPWPGGRPIGHEGLATIHALGAGVSTDSTGKPLQEGDRVTWFPIFSCQRCELCLAGDQHICAKRQVAFKLRGDEPPYFFGTFGDFFYLPPNHPVFKIPDDVADEEVVSVNCAMGTVFQGLVDAGIRQGHNVVVLGAGGLGLYATAFAVGMGAQEVIAVDGQQARLDMARRLGATATININDLKTVEQRVARVKDATRAHGADIVLELAGYGELVPEGLAMLAPQGTFVEIGNIVTGRDAHFHPRLLGGSKHMTFSSMYRPANVPRMLDFIQKNHDRLPIKNVISHKYALKDIDAAFAASEWAGGSTPVVRSAIVP
jgi:D-arabinose 1-dehydrogenase-like Zn-dependent alcohol dehydrogenase